jgi:hypothetical protein
MFESKRHLKILVKLANKESPMTEKLSAVRTLIAASEFAAVTDVAAEGNMAEIDSAVADIQKSLDTLKLSDSGKGSFGDHSEKVDGEHLKEQISRLKSASATSAKNYHRIYEILHNLEGAVVAAARPQNAAVRPKLAAIVKHVAGIFAEVDTTEDLDKPLSAVESAVHKLYNNGKVNDPSTYNFDSNGRGHHEKK